MNAKSQTSDEEDDEDGKSGSGEFGRPQLKPNLEALFDPAALIAAEQASGFDEKTTAFGDWEIQASSLTLFNKQKLKKLRLEELNAPSKLLRVVVGLATQNHGGAQGWDIENLIKAMDAVAQARFGKTLYQLASLSNDAARLDWRQGTLVQIEPSKSMPSPH